MIEIVPYKPSWPGEFQEIARLIRESCREMAHSIHHIGSTAVPGLAAKDIIDIQMTVLELDDPFVEPLTESGFKLAPHLIQDHCPPGQSLEREELAKKVFGYSGRRVNLHIRQIGKFNQRYPLLCRDYLRAHPAAANAYAEIKIQLAKKFPEDQDSYYDIKDPVFDIIMVGATDWAEATDWQLPKADA